MDVRKNLRVLVDAGWVVEYDYEPVTYGLNPDNSTVMALVGLFRRVG